MKAQRVNLTHERRQHVLGAALWTWKSSTRKSFTLADPLCRARVGVFAPVDVCCNRNMSGQAASSAARFAWRQDPANATGAMHTAARTSGPRGRGGRERGVEGKSLESSSVACAAAVNSIPTSDATGTLCLLVCDHDDATARARASEEVREGRMAESCVLHFSDITNAVAFVCILLFLIIRVHDFSTETVWSFGGAASRRKGKRWGVRRLCIERSASDEDPSHHVARNLGQLSRSIRQLCP